MLIQSKQIFYVNSRNRIDGSDSNFSYQLNLQDQDYDKAVVLQMSIPKSYYLVQSGKNTFILDEITQQTTIALPPGTYTRTNLRSTLETLLTNSSQRGWTYSVSVPSSTDAETGKFTFTVSNNSSEQPSFIFTDNLFEIMGFDGNMTYTFNSDALVSVNVINLQKESTLFLHSDICANKGDNILQCVDDPDYGHISYVCPDVEAYSKNITSKGNNIYNFYLADENDNMIDLNGQNIVFTLMLYKQETMKACTSVYEIKSPRIC